MSGVFAKLDIFPKTLEDYKIKTFTGGAISLFSLIIIVILFFTEFMYFLEVNRVDKLYVDTSGVKKIPIYIDMTFPAISCDALGIDVMDVSGEHQVRVDHTLFKQRLDLKTQKPIDDRVEHDVNVEDKDLIEKRKLVLDKVLKKDYCGSCYGSAEEGHCCNNCDDIRDAYRKKGWAFNPSENIEQCLVEVLERKMKYAEKEGCKLSGNFLVNKVAGNFHFAPGKSFQSTQMHYRDFLPYEVEHFNTTHIIHDLNFGVKYPGIKNPLEGTVQVVKEGSNLYQYFIKVVPTVYEYSDGSKIVTNQYSVTHHKRPKNQQHPNTVPGVFFMYDLSPIMMHMKETRKSFFHFITSLFAIIGGVFSVSSLLDTFLYQVSKPKRKPSII